uniref:Globin n=1 Tax=Meloidogyne javanica TaxID=6303 RepID=A0A915MT69_MELJA
IFCKADYVDCWEKASGGGPNPASMEEHIRMLIKFIDDLVQFVEGDSETQQIINSSSKCIGQQHAKTREAGRAWRTLIAFWTDE